MPILERLRQIEEQRQQAAVQKSVETQREEESRKRREIEAMAFCQQWMKRLGVHEMLRTLNEQFLQGLGTLQEKTTIIDYIETFREEGGTTEMRIYNAQSQIELLQRNGQSLNSLLSVEVIKPLAGGNSPYILLPGRNKYGIPNRLFLPSSPFLKTGKLKAEAEDIIAEAWLDLQNLR